jgi:hypothetical protein
MTVHRLMAVRLRVWTAHVLGLLGAFLALAPIAAMLWPALRAAVPLDNTGLWLAPLISGGGLLAIAVRLLESHYARTQEAQSGSPILSSLMSAP